MKGFKSLFHTLRFCTVFEEIQQFFRMKSKTRAEKKNLLVPQIQKFNDLIYQYNRLLIKSLNANW